MAKKYYDDKSNDGNAVGVRAATLDLVDQSAAISDTTFFTTTAAGLYVIAGSICVTTAGTGSGNTIQLVVKYPDASGTAITVSATALTGLSKGSAAVSNINTVAYLPAGVAVTYNETNGGTQTTHAVYDIHLSAVLVA
jgi:hypothetical protein